ncbi:MAG: hypothetical protein AAB403_15355, partial [Planctomycetota bacterium]
MTTGTDVKAIGSVIDEWMDAATANDPDGIVALLTGQFEMMPPGDRPVAGSDSRLKGCRLRSRPVEFKRLAGCPRARCGGGGC